MNFDTIWPLIQQLAVALVIPVAGAAGTFMVQKIKLASMNIKDKESNKITLACQVGVQAAQQKFKAGMIKDKKSEALLTTTKILDGAKVKYDPLLLGELIEAQVWDVLNSPAVNPAPIVVAPTIPPTPVVPSPTIVTPVKPPVTTPSTPSHSSEPIAYG
jgi:hypothetical protein